jgi:glycosyltransferase involved in cell wall biosynthesis
MRVLQVNSGPLFGAGAGGAERCCRDLSRWLACSGHDVLVAAPQSEGRPSDRIVALQPATWRPLRKLFYDYLSPANEQRLFHTIASFRPDVLHVHNIYGIGSRLIRMASEQVPTVVTVHDYWPIDLFVPRVIHGRLRYPLPSRLLFPWLMAHRAIHRRNLGHATLVCPSRYLARRLESGGYQAVRVIQNGLSSPAPTTAGEPRILLIGRLVPEKGFGAALAVIEPVAREVGWQIDVVGDGPLRAQLAHAYPGVRIHGHVDPGPFYQQAGILVMPSLWPENFPYVALEAMSYGIPLLATNVGGLPELIENGVTGMLYQPDDVHALASAIRRLAGDVALRVRLGRAAHDEVARNYTLEATASRYASLYAELSPHREGMNTQVRAG